MDSTNASLDRIKCPHCGKDIPVSETIVHQLSEQAQKEADEKMLELQKSFDEKENIFKKQQEQLKLSQQKLQATIDEKLKELAKDQEEKIRKETNKQSELIIEDLKQQSLEKDQKLQEAQKKELEVLKLKRQLEDEKRTFELDIEKTLDTERSKLKEEAERKIQDEYRMKDAEKEKKLQDALRMNEDLKRKLEQGSQQTQGEVKELQIEELLRVTFPIDKIEPVAKGVRGADAIHKVYSQYGNCVGTILWECKRTRSWSDGWITKLKEDMNESRADIAVIISDVLPNDIENFGHKDGVWVVCNDCVKELASVLRMQLSQVSLIRASNVGKNEKMEALYNYLMDPSFKHKVEGIMETFMSMKMDLLKEKTSFERIWSKREKQIEKVLKNTSGMYGDMQGVIGSELSNMDILELPEAQLDNEQDPLI